MLHQQSKSGHFQPPSSQQRSSTAEFNSNVSNIANMYEEDNAAGSGANTPTQAHQNEPFEPSPLKSLKDDKADEGTVLVFLD